MTHPTEEVLTIAEIVKLFRISKQAVWHAIDTDQLYARRSERTILIGREDAEARWGNGNKPRPGPKRREEGG